MNTITTLPECDKVIDTTSSFVEKSEKYSHWHKVPSESARNILRLMDQADNLMNESVMDEKEAAAIRQALQLPPSQFTGKELPTMD